MESALDKFKKKIKGAIRIEDTIDWKVLTDDNFIPLAGVRKILLDYLPEDGTLSLALDGAIPGIGVEDSKTTNPTKRLQIVLEYWWKFVAFGFRSVNYKT